VVSGKSRSESTGGERKGAGERAPDTVTSANNLTVVGKHGKYDAAEQMSKQELERRESVLGKNRPDTLLSAINLALLLQVQGKCEVAELVCRRALDRVEKEYTRTLTTAKILVVILRM
jgi:hypothetical protein